MWAEPQSLRRLLVMIVALGAAPLACSPDWRTDMWYQPSIRPEDAPRPEPEHSVPLNPRIHVEDRDDLDLPNPVPADARSVARGRVIFLARCQCCHGEAGHGGGPVSKVFPPAPDLAYQAIRDRSDGYIFGTIALGGRAMPSVGDGLTDRDRWDVVNFVRVIQGSRDGGR